MQRCLRPCVIALAVLVIGGCQSKSVQLYSALGGGWQPPPTPAPAPART
ncbi:MAG: hypothetical protein JO347_00430 [Candidatus Eremiobacteraeota bacterium]|nr:hypothetical protein [Candidatus Eremiobacteraeota bacterium]